MINTIFFIILFLARRPEVREIFSCGNIAYNVSLFKNPFSDFQDGRWLIYTKAKALNFLIFPDFNF